MTDITIAIDVKTGITERRATANAPRNAQLVQTVRPARNVQMDITEGGVTIHVQTIAQLASPVSIARNV